MDRSKSHPWRQLALNAVWAKLQRVYGLGENDRQLNPHDRAAYGAMLDAAFDDAEWSQTYTAAAHASGLSEHALPEMKATAYRAALRYLETFHLREVLLDLDWQHIPSRYQSVFADTHAREK